MTAPKPPDLAAVNDLLKRLLKWQQSNGYTQMRTTQGFLREYQESGEQHRRGSAAWVVVVAMKAASTVSTVIGRPARARAIGKVHVLRSHCASLQRELMKLDTQNARESFASKSRTFSDLGNDLIADLDAISKKLKVIPDADAPMTSASWSVFVAETAAKLQAAGMATNEIAELLQGATRATTKASLLRQTSRWAAGAARKNASKKKV
jgi:hypothetical protein